MRCDSNELNLWIPWTLLVKPSSRQIVQFMTFTAIDLEKYTSMCKRAASNSWKIEKSCVSSDLWANFNFQINSVRGEEDELRIPHIASFVNIYLLTTIRFLSVIARFLRFELFILVFLPWLEPQFKSQQACQISSAILHGWNSLKSERGDGRCGLSRNEDIRRFVGKLVEKQTLMY